MSRRAGCQRRERGISGLHHVALRAGQIEAEPVAAGLGYQRPPVATITRSAASSPAAVATTHRHRRGALP